MTTSHTLLALAAVADATGLPMLSDTLRRASDAAVVGRGEDDDDGPARARSILAAATATWEEAYTWARENGSDVPLVATRIEAALSLLYTAAKIAA